MRSMYRVLFVIILVMGAALSIKAQVGATAQVSGTVRDESGAVIPSAVISVKNRETGLIRKTKTDDSGFYSISGLSPGIYELKAEMSGFKTFVQPAIELTVGQSVTLDITLTVGQIEEVIEVRTEPPLVEPSKMEQSQIVSQRQVENLPINGRRFIDFALLTPNVSVGRSYIGTTSAPQLEAQATKISFAGLREFYSNNIRIDGADATTGYTGVQRLTPSQEATEEFRVLTGAYAAEFGRATGGIVNIITKSGKNDVHGSVYYFGRNDALDARNILRAPGFDVLRQHQFGFTLGGPLVKDRAFLFGNYEGQRRDESPIYSSFILAFLDQINDVKEFYGLSRERLDVLKKNDSDQFLIKAEVLGAKHTLSFKYEFNEQRNKNQAATIEGLGLPSNFRHNDIRDQSLVVNATVIGVNLTNQFLFQYGHRTFDNIPTSFEPHMQIANIMDSGRHAGPFDFYRETRLQFSDNLSYLHGQHQFKVGVDINHLRNRIIFSGFNPGLAIFIPDSFFGRPPFGRPTALLFVTSIPFGLRQGTLPTRDFAHLFPSAEWRQATTISPNHSFFEVFGQDRWRLAQKLTLNFGVRYSVETRPFNVVDEDLNNVQPRVGFAYALNEKTVIRGGGGIYTGPMHWSEVLGGLTPWGASDFPDARFRFSPVPPQNGPLGPPPGPFTAGIAFFNLTQNGVYPPVGSMIEWAFIKPVRDFPNPYAEQAILQIERQFGRDWGITAGWLFVHGLKNPAIRHINVKPSGTLPNGKQRFSILNPSFGFYQVLEPTQTSIYHAGNLVVQKRLSHHFHFVVNYTFSKTIDTTSPSVSLASVPENNLNARLDRALSSAHVAHRFVLSFLAEGPRRFLLTRDFRLGVITTLESARFYTIYAGFDANGDSQPANDRVGLLGRNTLRGDNLSNIDLRLSRILRLSERIHVELIAEFFNIFNTLNITDLDTVYGAADFLPGQPVPQSYTDRIVAPNPTFATPRAVSNPRQIQLAVRIRF